MFDIWAFLLQTLTASGVALLILVIKGMFRDKLPPKWQFGIWGVLGIAMLLPAGLGGRYVLLNWPMIVDALRLSTGDYSFTKVLFPFPVLAKAPESVWEWLFAIYVCGVLLHLAKYVLAYVRLRRVLVRGREINDSRMAMILTIAAELKVPLCKCVEVSGLPSAFVCGFYSPVLVLPSESELDEKILHHELLHLKNRDTCWSILVCLCKALHWCNPLLIYCSNQVLNDLEARCDQMVLEMLEGEERRDYGRILLSMANDQYARTPGATCINNGGKAIRQRIEAIARFKRYPAGMRLVSICAAIVLMMPVVVGVRAVSLYETGSISMLDLASARTVYCRHLRG
jgi:beta-lactamase regulating signal transducer with metallopeptidase domain